MDAIHLPQPSPALHILDQTHGECGQSVDTACAAVTLHQCHWLHWWLALPTVSPLKLCGADNEPDQCHCQCHISHPATPSSHKLCLVPAANLEPPWQCQCIGAGECLESPVTRDLTACLPGGMVSWAAGVLSPLTCNKPTACLNLAPQSTHYTLVLNFTLYFVFLVCSWVCYNI